MIVNNLSKIYFIGKREKRALDDVSIEFPEKGMIFIHGKSGSGKTTLLNILSGIEKPTSGQILISGIRVDKMSEDELLSYRNSYCGIVFQEYNLLDSLNVYDNVKLALDVNGSNEKDVNEVLKSVGLPGFGKKKIYECSGGERQRVAIARTLIKDPKMILCDEPTGALDSKNGRDLMNLLKELSKERLIIIVSHDDDLVKEYSDGTIELSDGKIISDSIPKREIKTPFTIESSRMTAKRKISLGLLGILKHPFRFALNIISISLSFLILILLFLFIGTNENNSYINTIRKDESYHFSLVRMKNGFEYRIKDEDVLMAKEKLNSSVIPVLYEDISIENIEFKSELTYYSIMPIGYAPGKYFDDSYNIIGKMPRNDNEIAITKYMSEVISFNENDGDVNKSCLNKHLVLNGCDYIVTGIIDIDVDNRFDYLKNSNNQHLEEDFLKYLNDSLLCMVVVSDIEMIDDIYIYHDPIVISDKRPALLDEIEKIDESHNLKKIDKDGILIPVSKFVALLDTFDYGKTYNGVYCMTNMDLLNEIIKEEEGDIYVTSLVTDILFRNFDKFEPIFSNFKARDMEGEREYDIVGIYESEYDSSACLMSENLFNNLYDKIGGTYSKIIVNKTDSLKYGSLNELKEMEYGLINKNAANHSKEFADSKKRIQSVLITLAICVIGISFSMFIMYVNQMLVSKSNFIAVLKMLGLSKKDANGIVLYSVIPIVLSIGIISTALSIPLFPIFDRTFYALYEIRVEINWIYYLYVFLILSLLSLFTAGITIYKMNKLSIKDIFHTA